MEIEIYLLQSTVSIYSPKALSSRKFRVWGVICLRRQLWYKDGHLSIGPYRHRSMVIDHDRAPLRLFKVHCNATIENDFIDRSQASTIILRCPLSHFSVMMRAIWANLAIPLTLWYTEYGVESVIRYFRMRGAHNLETRQHCLSVSGSLCRRSRM